METMKYSFIVLIVIAHVHSLNLQAIDFEHCVFNLVTTDYSVNQRAKMDLVERILVKNQGITRRWTLGIEVIADEDDMISSLLNDLPYFKEICSVNILVAIDAQSCFRDWLVQTFGSRLYDEQNTLIIIYDEQSQCIEMPPETQISPIFLDMFYVFLEPKTGNVTRTLTICPECSQNYWFRWASSTMPNLSSLKDLSVQIKTASYLPIMGMFGQFSGSSFHRSRHCEWFYPKRPNLKPQLVGSNWEHILAEILGDKFNLTVEYILPNVQTTPNYYVAQSPKHYTVIAVFEKDEWNPFSHYSPIKFWTQTLNAKRELKFFYCTKGLERESFSFEFWTIPFDGSSWLFIAGTVSIVALLLGGQWFAVYAILMRQDCRVLEQRRLLIIFIFASLIFTYGYEGIISGWLTIPPPIIVYKTLKELIGNGYRVMAYEAGPRFMTKIRNICKREEISTLLLNSSMYTTPYDCHSNSGSACIDLLAGCNLIHFTKQLEPERTAYMRSNYGVYCRNAVDTVFPNIDIQSFRGHLHSQLAFATQVLREAGIPWMLEKYTDNEDKGTRIRLGLKYEIQDNGIKPFSMKDWKILSIFLGWAILLGVTVILFTVIQFYYLLKSYRWRLLCLWIRTGIILKIRRRKLVQYLINTCWAKLLQFFA